MVAAGIAFAALDLRVMGVDAAPDLVGWALVGYGAWRLQQRTPAALAWLAAAASAAELSLPYRIERLDPRTGEVVADPVPGIAYSERLLFEHLDGARLLLVVAALVVGGAATWHLLRTLQRRAQATGDVGAARGLRLGRWLVLVAWVAPYAALAMVQGLGGDGFDPVWNGPMELVALPGALTAGALVVMLALHSNRGWTATDDERASPWSELMTRDL